MAVKRAVFLDKDGTLIPDVPYNVNPALISLMPGAGDALRALHNVGYRLIVVTNQAGVARGYFKEADLGGVYARLRELLLAYGVPLDGFYYCPHLAEGKVAPYARKCLCRKPEPGMILRAAHEHSIDTSHSWFVGDILNDVEAGQRAGCRTVMIDNGGETEWVGGAYREPHHTVRDISEAARMILGEEGNVTPFASDLQSAQR